MHAPDAPSDRPHLRLLHRSSVTTARSGRYENKQPTRSRGASTGLPEHQRSFGPRTRLKMIVERIHGALRYRIGDQAPRFEGLDKCLAFGRRVPHDAEQTRIENDVTTQQERGNDAVHEVIW